MAIAKEYAMWLVHDIAYAEITFDGYEAPSVLQVPGAKEIAVEFYSCPRRTTCRAGGLDACAGILPWLPPWHG